MRTRNLVAVLLTVVSLAMLIPGLLAPLITITASMDLFGTPRELFRETRSILGAIRSLHDSGNDFVAGLILLFSVLVPTIKALLLVVVLRLRQADTRYRLYLFVRSISKWSMADVFVVGVFIALLAAKATDNLDGVIGRGFYWFTGYSLVSNLAFQFLVVEEGGRRGDAPASPEPRVVTTGGGE